MAVKGSEHVRTEKPSEAKAKVRQAEQEAMLRGHDHPEVPQPAKLAAVTPAKPQPEFQSKAAPIDQFPDVADILPDMAARHRELTNRIKALEDERDQLADDIKVIFEVAGHQSISMPGIGLTAFQVNREGSSSIKAELLLQKGVSFDTITECTVKGKPYSYVSVVYHKGFGQ